MIKFEHMDIHGWDTAIRGMRNPMNSWDKSDSLFYDLWYAEDDTLSAHNITCQISQCFDEDDSEFQPLMSHDVYIGTNDHTLMMKLAKAGSEHSKYRRFITVTMDITAPLYWWKEFDTYKVGTVANSCSTMHKIHDKEFELDDFSHEHLSDDVLSVMDTIIFALNMYRDIYLETKDKRYWWQMIQLLPSSYNQKRTVMLNYEVLAHIYSQRNGHKLDEWNEFCGWIERLPYSELITLEVKE